jgi:hypothetical protein
MDKVNDRWSELVIPPALMMGMEDTILDRISFGGVKELQLAIHQFRKNGC